MDRVGVQLKLSAQEMAPTAAKLGSAATMSSVRVTTLKQLGSQVLAQRARYEAALAVVCKTGATYKKRAALQVCIDVMHVALCGLCKITTASYMSSCTASQNCGDLVGTQA